MGHIMENFIIYAENLSYFYILCIVVTFLAIVVTWSIDIPKANKNFDVYHKPLTIEEESQTSESVMDDKDDEQLEVNKFPHLEKKFLLENMSKSLNSVDLEKEKERGLTSNYQLGVVDGGD
ncbi:uncharacterized protein isoform X2 [Rhodnius prolixus]|uniref:uncharacterized protein isoform X2 n=1 Tax=Rhodnius prolixus TaxID=13249 RepID=UPI003D18B92F